MAPPQAITYNDFPHEITNGPQGTESQWGTWECTNHSYASNQCVKYSDLKFTQASSKPDYYTFTLTIKNIQRYQYCYCFAYTLDSTFEYLSSSTLKSILASQADGSLGLNAWNNYHDKTTITSKWTAYKINTYKWHMAKITSSSAFTIVDGYQGYITTVTGASQTNPLDGNIPYFNRGTTYGLKYGENQSEVFDFS